MSAPYLLDCDTGIDDAFAVAWLATHPEVNLVGVTSVFGNTVTRQAARNSLDLLDLLGRRDVPVTVGAEVTLRGEGRFGAPHIHGRNGIGDVQLARANRDPEQDETSAEMIVRLSRQYAGELRIVAVGPLTNLALALRLDPTLPQRVAQVTVMGGAALAPGNDSPRTEANITNDVEAAADVFAAEWDLTTVGLDVTMRNVLELDEQQRMLEAKHPAVRAIAQMMPVYFEFYRSTHLGRDACGMHDPLAAAIATGDVLPSLAPVVPAFVDVTEGPLRGSTVYDLRARYRGFEEAEDAGLAGGAVRVVMECGEDFGSRLTERLLSL